MKYFRFQLEKGSKKHTCPNCGKKTFVRYIDTENYNRYLPSEYGKCDRLDNCDHHYNPYKDGYGKKDFTPDHPKPNPVKKAKTPTAEWHPIPDHVVNSYPQNQTDNFSQFLINRYGERAKKVLKDYRVAKADFYGHKDGTVFWQNGADRVVHEGQVMLYNPKTGKRVKDKDYTTTWIHRLHPDLKSKERNLRQRFFGTHLVQADTETGQNIYQFVFVVESPKTALIGACVFPQFGWVATCGLTNVSSDALLDLLGQNLILIPDLKQPDADGKTNVHAWANRFTKKIKEAYNSKRYKELTKERGYKTPFNISIFTGLESIATDAERVQGWDIADYLLNCPERLEGLVLTDAHPIHAFEGIKVKDIPALKPDTDSGIKYLGQDSKYWQFFNDNDSFILQSSPNSGKTESTKQACQRDKVATLVLLPTCAIARQQAERHKGNLLISKQTSGQVWTNEDLINGLNCGEMFFLSYEYYSELLKRGVLNYAYQGFYMFVDEAHELENQDNIRRNAIDDIVHYTHRNCLKKVYMTGTPSFTLSRSLGGLPIYKSKIANKVKLIFNICTFDSNHSNTVKATASRMSQVKESLSDVVQLCRHNDKDKNIELTERLRSRGGSTACIFGERTQKAYPDPLSELVRESVQNTETIPDGVDFVICTSVWDTGVNIRNKNVRAVLVYNGRVGFEAYNMYQFVSRFREVETLEVDLIISDNNLKEGTDLDELIQSISELYDTKVNQYQLEAESLKGESVSELHGRTPDLVNLRPRYRHNGERWHARTTHAGNECQREFSRGLPVVTGVNFLQINYNCIQSVEVKTIKERETYFDQSAKDKEALEAIAVISEMLKDATQRRYLYALAVEDGGEQLVKQINMFDPAFSYTYAKDSILPTAEYREWFKKHERTLNVGAYMDRVKYFIKYMVCINHVEICANWIKEYSDTTKANAQYAKVNLAVHRFIESESDLKEAYRRDARNELEREKINDILTIASQYVGKEYGVSELWALILSQYKDADRFDITERQILRMVKAGYQYEERKASKAYYITLTRRTELADVVGTELESNVKDTISAMVKGVRGNDSNIITNPLTPFTTKPEPEPVETVASVETVQVIARQTVEVPEPTPTADGYYGEFMLNGKLQRVWIDLSVFPKAGSN